VENKLDLTDEALVNSFRATKEARYFKTLVGRYQNRIYNAAFRILGNSHESEEVVQDTFIRVLQNIQSFRNQSTFAAWMFRISHNLCIDMVRTNRRKGMQVMSFDPHSHNGDSPHEATLNVVTQIADPVPGPSQQVDSKEQQQAVVDSLNQLPEPQRIVLVLHDMEGFSYQEIADIVGANIGTVRSRLHYGRIKLRELLSPYFNPAPVVPHPR
jgi:RNA polymerase sigma-70 factor, ECF subfamily